MTGIINLIQKLEHIFALQIAKNIIKILKTFTSILPFQISKTILLLMSY